MLRWQMVSGHTVIGLDPSLNFSDTTLQLLQKLMGDWYIPFRLFF